MKYYGYTLQAICTPSQKRTWDLLAKDLRDGTELIEIPVDKGTASILEYETNHVRRNV